MRRWFQHFIPVLILTVALQILAPVGLIWAATAGPDPLTMAPICSELGHEPVPVDGALPLHGSCCPLCSIAQAPALPPANGDGLFIDRAYDALTWTIVGVAGDCERFIGRAKARAPPELS